MVSVAEKRLAVKIESNLYYLAGLCIADKTNPHEKFDDPIAKAIIAELDKLVESGDIEDIAYSLEEIIMVIGWIEG